MVVTWQSIPGNLETCASMLSKGWDSVADNEPTLNQHWVKASCSLDTMDDFD